MMADFRQSWGPSSTSRSNSLPADDEGVGVPDGRLPLQFRDSAVFYEPTLKPTDIR